MDLQKIGFYFEHTYARHPDCQFIEFAYLPDRLYSPYHPLSPGDKNWAIFWAATTRYVGLHYAKSEHLLFLDSDEIAEGEKVVAWLEKGEYLHYDALRLAAWYYALKPNCGLKKW